MSRSIFSSSLRLLSSFALVSLAGCAGADDPEAAPSAFVSELSATDTSAILALVNYPGTDLAVLDVGANLDARAARNIVAYRVGPDGIEPSIDDLAFVDLSELDAVPYVGDAAFRNLQAYGLAHPPPGGEDVEGVHFAGWESEAVVWGVNHVDVAVLDGMLDGRAAQGLVAHRPLASVTAMGPVAYVGTSALTHLRSAAPTWWNAMRGTATTPASLAGTFDSVAFDDVTAHVAIAIANGASSAELTGHGVTATPAARIIAARPFTTLAQVAAVSGVGTATMNALATYARSGTWGAEPSSTCIPSFESAVAPHLADLLFMSESDRAIELVSFPGAGVSAPTASSVRALVGAPSSSTTETRSVDDFFVAFEPSSDAADPDAALLVEAAIRAQLTNLICVKIHNTSDRAVVPVYLLGRTPCGDLVGLRSIAIET